VTFTKSDTGVTKQATVNHELGFVSIDIMGENSLLYILNHTKKGG